MIGHPISCLLIKTAHPLNSLCLMLPMTSLRTPSISATCLNGRVLDLKLRPEDLGCKLDLGSSHLSGLVLSKIPTQPCLTSRSVSTEHMIVYNMCALVLPTNHDFQFLIFQKSPTQKV